MRSAGGWCAVKHAVQTADERVVGNGSFVERVLQQAEEERERRLRLHALGSTPETLMRRVA